MPTLPARCLQDFVQGFMEYTKYNPTGTLFREWAAITAISGALTRRVWLQANPTLPPLYPNLFVMLVGRPGSGKDIAMNTTRSLWLAVDEASKDEPMYGLRIGARSLSAKGLIDALASEHARLTLENAKGRPIEFHSLLLCVPELGVLIPEYNPALISNLNELYNCNESFEDQVRGMHKGEPLIIVRPHVTMLLGTQPSFLGSTFPVEAFKMGFFSRTILVFEPSITRQPLFQTQEMAQKLAKTLPRLWAKLTSDLRLYTHLTGQFKVPAEVGQAINEFHEHECDTSALAHSRFEDYNTRRSLHLQKLAMCFSVARSNDLVLEMHDLERAKDLLFRTEARMPTIFADMELSSGFNSTTEEVLYANQTKDGLISQRDLIFALRKRVRPNELMAVINSMLASGEIEDTGEVRGGFPIYRICTTPEDKT